LFGTWQHHLTLGTSLLDFDVNALDWNDGIVFVQGSGLNQPIVGIDKWLLPSYIVLTISGIVFLSSVEKVGTTYANPETSTCALCRTVWLLPSYVVLNISRMVSVEKVGMADANTEMPTCALCRTVY
jgi:hypothetical protein